jgi:hypothetical protein
LIREPGVGRAIPRQTRPRRFCPSNSSRSRQSRLRLKSPTSLPATPSASSFSPPTWALRRVSYVRSSSRFAPVAAIAIAASMRRSSWCWPPSPSRKRMLKGYRKRRCERRTASQAHRVKGHKRLRSATSVAQRREPREPRILLLDGQPDGANGMN